jgi:hypothetical protein
MEGLCFVIFITVFIRPNSGKDVVDDYDVYDNI